MRSLFCLLSVAVVCAFGQTPEQPSEEARLLGELQSLHSDLPANVDAASATLWRLCQVSSQAPGSRVHWQARGIADKVSQADPFNPRSRFVYGYFRLLEGFQTFDPVTQRRRQSEGKKILDDALMMGARDGRFLHDAGMLLLALSPRIGMTSKAVDALSLSRTTLGEEFASQPEDRRADWYAGMGKGLDGLGLTELARQHFSEAAAIAPQTHSGEMARDWLRARFGG